MIVDCDSCVVRGAACAGCVISVLLGAPPNLELDGSDQRAIAALADAGLVPRLRLVPVSPQPGVVAEWSTASGERPHQQFG